MDNEIDRNTVGGFGVYTGNTILEEFSGDDETAPGITGHIDNIRQLGGVSRNDSLPCRNRPDINAGAFMHLAFYKYGQVVFLSTE